VALLALFEIAHREEVTCQFMATKHETLAAKLAVHANAAREAARAAAEEEAGGRQHAWQRRQRLQLRMQRGRRRSRRRRQQRHQRGRRSLGTRHARQVDNESLNAHDTGWGNAAM
jgi:hypothetical protein